MKKLFLLFLLAAPVILNAQYLYRVNLYYDGRLESFSLMSGNDNITINISPEGEVLAYGAEIRSDRYNDFTRLEKYLGRTELYSNFDDTASRGKLKYLGQTAITWYKSFEGEFLKGKIKSVGPLQFDYYREFDDKLLRGKIKSIGRNNLDYYSSFDNEAFRGKLKQLGPIPLSYYPSFEDKAYKGKLKAIGTSNFSYYNSFDRQFAGSLKNPVQSVYLNGIQFYFKY